MIIEQTGNILDSTCDLIVIPVNTMGVMGKGLAKEFKDRFNDLYHEYKRECIETHIGGDIFPLNYRYNTPYKSWYWAFCTKENWQMKSKLEWIERGLQNIILLYPNNYVRIDRQTIAIPPLGCGLGGLNWDDVYPLIQKYLGNIEGLTVHVYLPKP